MKVTSLCVYCGSSPGLLPEYLASAYSFGALLASRGIAVVYGGGNVGLMGALADGALTTGGKVIGVMPVRLIEKEVAHQGLTEFHAVDSMHARKMKMASLADAFVALPGGIGTLEEIFEVYSWTQLGFQQKPCAFLNVADFYTPLMEFLARAVEQRFIRPEHYAALLVDNDPDRLIQQLESYRPVAVDKWIDRSQAAGNLMQPPLPQVPPSVEQGEHQQ